MLAPNTGMVALKVWTTSSMGAGILISSLANVLDEYAILAEEIFYLLIEYDNYIFHKFCDLADREDFSDFTEFEEE